MARITCSKSGVIFQCEHMPVALPASSFTHPIFHLHQHKLISLAGKWAAQQLTPTESYLLYLALLDSTSLIVWRAHATYHTRTDSIVASNMQALLSIIGKINLITHPSFALPSFAITAETHTLLNSNHWIESWTDNYSDWYEGRREEALRAKLEAREDALQRLIKSSIPPEQYATKLADWANTAASFPTFDIQHPITKLPISVGDYWKQLIKCAADEDKLWRFPRKDIEELVEHCEDNLQMGDIYSHTLMRYLRRALVKYDDYLGFGDTPTTHTPFKIMSSDSSVQEINTAALLSTAPTEEPKKHQYATLSSWLKAYTKWKLAQVRSTQS